MNFKITDYDKEQPLLHCPIPGCQVEYTHLERVDEYTDEEGRKGVVLHFSCEEGHTFSHDLHNHKGYTMSRTEISEPVSLPQQ